jgi:outer membrane assembly lipoprotein YfiO
MHAMRRLLPAIALFVLGGCFLGKGPQFDPRRFTSNEALFQTSLQRLQRRSWDDAARGFERLTQVLPARDSLLPLSFFYLARAQEGNREFLLAAQSFGRLAESFPQDSLADDAMLNAAKDYEHMWHKPSLDPTYGQTAMSTLRAMLALYPDSPLKADAEKEIAHLNEWFAVKDFDIGEHYFRRKAWDSAIIYFRDIVKLYPDVPTTRRALLRLAESYRAIRYREDEAETCAKLRQRYPDDREVRQQCGNIPVTAAAHPDSAAVIHADSTTPPPPAVPPRR